MTRITITSQKKNTMMPGTAYPATVLALATAASYPPQRDLFSADTLHVAHAGIDSASAPSVNVTLLAAIAGMRGPGRMMPVRFSGSAAHMLTTSPA